MNLFYSVTIVLCLHYVISLPIDKEKSLYDAIVEICPSVSTIPNYKNFTFFNSCKDWKSIKTVDKLTANNAGEIRCLLYFVTFTQYCTNNTNKLNVDIPRSVMISYDKKTVCDYMKTFNNSSLGKIFEDEDNCQKICIDDMGLINSVCSISYYFAHLKSNASVEPKSQQNSQLLTAGTGGKPNLPNILHVEQGPRQNIPASLLSEKTGISKLGQSESRVNADAAEPRNMLKLDSDKSIQQNNNINTETVSPNPAEVNEQVNQETKPQNSNANVQDSEIGTNNDHETQNSNIENNVKGEDTVVKTSEKTNQEKIDMETNKVASKDQQNLDETPQVVGPNMEDEDDEEDIQNQDNDDDLVEGPANAGGGEKASKPLHTDESEPVNYDTEMQGDSYFFTYFMILCIISIVGYVCYHNKQKILALILEGRRGKRQYRSRRPNSANYHKLDSNLEEAINSSCTKNTNNVIY